MIMRLPIKAALFCLIFVQNFYALNGGYSTVLSIVERVAKKFGENTPIIFEEMRNNRMFNRYRTPTCLDVSLRWGNLVIGDLLLQKLDSAELELLITRAFIQNKIWYTTKKVALILSLLLLNAYFFNSNKDAPGEAGVLFLIDAFAYFGFNFYMENYADQETLEITGTQELLDKTYEKLSPPRLKYWWPSFYKNFWRYIG